MYYYIAFFVFGYFFVSADDQSVSVRLTIICGEDKDSNVIVRLYDKDTTDPNDLMKQETFKYGLAAIIKGSENEFTTIDPILEICHKCGTPNPQKTIIELPDSFVTDGVNPNLKDLGIVDLMIQPSEDTDICK